MKWFRLYYEFATDPKIQSMGETLQRRYIMLLCLKGNGDLETITEEEIAFALRISDEELAETKKLFTKKKLIVSGWKIRTWDDRQFKSDDSKERVGRYRNKMKRDSNVTVTTQETEQNRNRTETDKEKDKNNNAITEINICNKKVVLNKKKPLADSTVVVDALKKIGIGGDRATQIYQKYGSEYLIRKIFLYEYMKLYGNGQIKNPLAWIQNAIKSDYEESDTFLEWLGNKKQTILDNPAEPYELKKLVGLI